MNANENRSGVLMVFILLIVITGQGISYIALDGILKTVLQDRPTQIIVTVSGNDAQMPEIVTETGQIGAEKDKVVDFMADIKTPEYEPILQAVAYEGVLTPAKGVNYYNGCKETFYNLPMDLVVTYARQRIEGMEDAEVWVREDGAKMLGEYIMCAACYDVHPYGSTLQSSMGECIVVDTGGFALYNPNQIDIAVTW